MTHLYDDSCCLRTGAGSPSQSCGVHLVIASARLESDKLDPESGDWMDHPSAWATYFGVRGHPKNVIRVTNFSTNIVACRNATEIIARNSWLVFFLSIFSQSDWLKLLLLKVFAPTAFTANVVSFHFDRCFRCFVRFCLCRSIRGKCWTHNVYSVCMSRCDIFFCYHCRTIYDIPLAWEILSTVY